MSDLHSYTNGDEGLPSPESGSEEEEGAEELSLEDAGAPARALAALNALRKSWQHYDVVVEGGGASVAAHRAVLGAASPYLLQQLADAGAQYRVPEVAGSALRALVEYAYSGRLAVRDAAAARDLYAAACRLRVEPVRAHLAAALLRRPRPHACLLLRALPDLHADHLAQLDAYIADNFDEVCESGALSSLPQLSLEVMRDGGEDAPLALAEAALAWLQDQPHADVEELCARTHLVYVDSRGAMRDCGEKAGDAGEPQQPRREARAAGDAVVAARRAPGGARALLALGGRAVAARLRCSPLAGGVASGAPLAGQERRARMLGGRAAHSAHALADRLLVCGGYDRARVLRSAEAYDPAANAWQPLPEMLRPRARFAAARLRSALWVLGGSDGHADLDSVHSFETADGWRARATLPLPLTHAAAAADEERGHLYVLGGWAAGNHLKRVMRYSPDDDTWTEAPPLITGRSQCGGVWWRGAAWALGGCDAWRCLATTERLARGAAAWVEGPALPSARRAVGAAEWRGLLVAAGGSAGAASLRDTAWLAAGDAPAWAPGPPLRRARAATALADVAGALYAVGGFDGKEFLSCVECLLAPDADWTALCDPQRPPHPLPPPDPSETQHPDPTSGQ